MKLSFLKVKMIEHWQSEMVQPVVQMLTAIVRKIILILQSSLPVNTSIHVECIAGKWRWGMGLNLPVILIHNTYAFLILTIADTSK